jgi:hypothetical protein
MHHRLTQQDIDILVKCHNSIVDGEVWRPTNVNLKCKNDILFLNEAINNVDTNYITDIIAADYVKKHDDDDEGFNEYLITIGINFELI